MNDCGLTRDRKSKQKTAYEIHERDWSSDVCSSDLLKTADVNGKKEKVKLLGLPEDNNWVLLAPDRKSVV